MSKISYEDAVEEIRELQGKIRLHQQGAQPLDDYVGCLKRLQFLRNSIRSTKKRKAARGKK